MREADYKTNLEVAGKSPSRKSCAPTSAEPIHTATLDHEILWERILCAKRTIKPT